MMLRLRPIAALAALLVALATSSAPVVVGQDATPAASPSSIAPGVVGMVMAEAWSDTVSGDRLELARIALAPGASVPAHTRPGDELLFVEQGALTVTTLAGPGGPDRVVDTGDGPGVIHREMYGEGRSVAAGPTDIQVWENQTTEPTVVLSMALLHGEDPAIFPVVVAPSPTSPSPSPQPPVVKRLTLTGQGAGGRYRITVRDRSGHLTGARLPSPAELRFAAEGPGLIVDHDSGPRSTPVLLRWEGTPCAPVVDLDIAADLSEIRLHDRTPGCDASAVGHWLVLEFDRHAPLDETQLTFDESP